MKIYNPFKHKSIDSNLVTEIESITTFGKYCPKCKSEDLFSHLTSENENSYICENCLNHYNEEEYTRLMKIDLRKRKILKINENR